MLSSPTAKKGMRVRDGLVYSVDGGAAGGGAFREGRPGSAGLLFGTGVCAHPQVWANDGTDKFVYVGGTVGK